MGKYLLYPSFSLNVLNVYKIIIWDCGDACPELVHTWKLVVKRSSEPQPLHQACEEDAQFVLCQRISHANSSPYAEGHHLWKISL